MQEGKEKGGKRLARFNLSLEAMARATCAYSAKARKLASKHAGVLDLLREESVKVEDTGLTVKREGLERLYSKWVKQKKAHKQAAGARPEVLPKAGRRVLLADDNDKETLMPLWLKLSARDQILNSKFGAKLTVILSRVSEDDGDICVERVLPGDSVNDRQR